MSIMHAYLLCLSSCFCSLLNQFMYCSKLRGLNTHSHACINNYCIIMDFINKILYSCKIKCFLELFAFLSSIIYHFKFFLYLIYLSSRSFCFFLQLYSKYQLPLISYNQLYIFVGFSTTCRIFCKGNLCVFLKPNPNPNPSSYL